ncbi:MAG TPA: phosphoribosylformylglycinamidine cyclo-ligase [Longimicrobiales bacterium]|nr:phosphoribosylformylglycinamidine cyclo-ligase [Longimicrobiales bacterium]
MSEGAAGGLTYGEAGVDREVAARTKDRIAGLVESTRNAGVVSRAGGFGGLFRVPAGYAKPVMVSSADGVGTKLKVAIMADRHDTVGLDLVNHCVNDILVEGARPLFFMDYIGMGRLQQHVVEDVVAGLARGCRANDCVLLGGETAEMPDFYAAGEYDLAGFIVGMVDEDARPGAHRVHAGDDIIALASSGFHTNGYSLLRRLLFDRLGLAVTDPYPGADESVADILLRPHRSYASSVLPLIEAGSVSALAHITGGGIPENLVRVLPDDIGAVVDRASWSVPREFAAVQEHGDVTDREMFLTFNMGVGMLLVVPPAQTDAVLRSLQDAGETAWVAGSLQAGGRSVELQ